MGTQTDMRLRVIKRRVDNAKRVDKVKRARKIIYDLGRSVRNSSIEEFLKAESYVPTVVRGLQLLNYINITKLCL